ncbi:hypothetical protein BDR03DRAFT_1096179 [Suillus americanus]|nr:hypothetical protein BDR03DRAFT_1096179 [Suillus americanus]
MLHASYMFAFHPPSQSADEFVFPSNPLAQSSDPRLRPIIVPNPSHFTSCDAFSQSSTPRGC